MVCQHFNTKRSRHFKNIETCTDCGGLVTNNGVIFPGES